MVPMDDGWMLHNTLQEQNARLQAQIGELRSQNEWLYSQNCELQEQNAEMHEGSEWLCWQNDKLKAEIGETHSKVEAWCFRNRELASELLIECEAFVAMRSEVRQYSSELNSLSEANACIEELD